MTIERALMSRIRGSNSLHDMCNSQASVIEKTGILNQIKIFIHFNIASETNYLRGNCSRIHC